MVYFEYISVINELYNGKCIVIYECGREPRFLSSRFSEIMFKLCSLLNPSVHLKLPKWDLDIARKKMRALWPSVEKD